MTYRIIISPTALKMLQQIKDRRVQIQLRDRISALSTNPEQQGKALIKELARYRSLRAIGQRYRIIYRIQDDKVQVCIVAIGLRKEGDKKDIYELTRKLIRLGLLNDL